MVGGSIIGVRSKRLDGRAPLLFVTQPPPKKKQLDPTRPPKKPNNVPGEEDGGEHAGGIGVPDQRLRGGEEAGKGLVGHQVERPGPAARAHGARAPAPALGAAEEEDAGAAIGRGAPAVGDGARTGVLLEDGRGPDARGGLGGLLRQRRGALLAVLFLGVG